MVGLVHGLMVAGLMAAPATGSGTGASPPVSPMPVRFVCNVDGRCFENGDLRDRSDRDDRDERRRDRHRHEDDDEE